MLLRLPPATAVIPALGLKMEDPGGFKPFLELQFASTCWLQHNHAYSAAFLLLPQVLGFRTEVQGRQASKWGQQLLQKGLGNLLPF